MAGPAKSTWIVDRVVFGQPYPVEVEAASAAEAAAIVGVNVPSVGAAVQAAVPRIGAGSTSGPGPSVTIGNTRQNSTPKGH